MSSLKDEDDIILFSYNYLCSFLMNMSHNYSAYILNLIGEVVEPFQQFQDNFRETNNAAMAELKTMVDELTEEKKNVKILQPCITSLFAASDDTRETRIAMHPLSSAERES